jgi:oxygen-independent coproporphyrinogen-3 oxidase
VPWLKPGQRMFTEKDLPLDEEKRNLYEIGKAMFSEIGYVEVGMDHFALNTDSLFTAAENGDLHRNFMGYTHSNTQLMVGLGVSSISDTWYTFGQNVKIVEEYYKLVNAGKFPIFRGHILNEEDLILRRHILNCICKFETSWSKPEEQTVWLKQAILKLAEVEKDNLINIESESLTIPKSARPFIRNICMAFDAKLARKAPNSSVFSSTV